MPKNILVVDDEQDIRTTLSDIIQTQQHNITQAVDGQDCIAKVNQSRPDIIFLDVMMPGLKTKEILEQLKNIGDIPVILVTVVRFSEEELNDLLSNTQVVNYIPKPFDIDKILEVLQTHAA